MSNEDEKKDERFEANKPGEPAPVIGSINEPPPEAPPPFRAPEQPAEQPAEQPREEPDADPDDLEDEIDEAEAEGDFKPTHRKPTLPKRKK